MILSQHEFTDERSKKGNSQIFDFEIEAIINKINGKFIDKARGLRTHILFRKPCGFSRQRHEQNIVRMTDCVA